MRLTLLAAALLVAALLPPTAADARGWEPPRPALLQMNLCNSGFAGCYATLNQGRAIGEAVALIRSRRPAAVTLNEMCAGDLAKLGRATGYRGIFSQSGTQGCDPADHPDYRGADLRYGNIVMVAPGVPATGADAAHTFAGQAGLTEQRTVRCLRVLRARVCVTHLAPGAGAQAQARELRGLLERWAARGPVLLGGDLNLRTLPEGGPADAGSAVPSGWAHVDDGRLQHAIASPPLAFAPPRVTPLAFTDHPALEAPLTVAVALRPGRRG